MINNWYTCHTRCKCWISTTHNSYDITLDQPGAHIEETLLNPLMKIKIEESEDDQIVIPDDMPAVETIKICDDPPIIEKIEIKDELDEMNVTTKIEDIEDEDEDDDYDTSTSASVQQVCSNLNPAFLEEELRALCEQSGIEIPSETLR